MTGHVLGLMVAVLSGYLAKVAVDRWKIWNERVKNPSLGKGPEEQYQNELAWKAILFSAASAIVFLLTLTIPPDILITIISN